MNPTNVFIMDEMSLSFCRLLLIPCAVVCTLLLLWLGFWFSCPLAPSVSDCRRLNRGVITCFLRDGGTTTIPPMLFRKDLGVLLAAFPIGVNAFPFPLVFTAALPLEGVVISQSSLTTFNCNCNSSTCSWTEVTIFATEERIPMTNLQAWK